MRIFLVTIAFLCATSAGICQTPFPDTTRKAADTMLPVPVTKLRLLIHDREAWKICARQVLQQDSMIDLQTKELRADSQQLTAMFSLDADRRSQLADKDQLLGFSAQREKIYIDQIKQGAADLTRQKRKTVTVGAMATGVIVFLSYLLIKK